MTKIYSESPQTKAIYDKIMNKIQGKATLAGNEYFVKRWYSNDGIPHSGQIYAKKVLPNGNIQTRITTVIGDVAAIVNDIRVISKNGKLKKDFYSIKWCFNANKPKMEQSYTEKVSTNGEFQTRFTMSTINDGTIITDTRVKNPQGVLLNAYFGIRGPRCTITNRDGNIIRDFLATKLYANNLYDVKKAIINQKSRNAELKFLF